MFSSRVLGSLVALSLLGAAPSKAEIENGKPAPSVELKGLDVKSGALQDYKLDSFKGKYVVLEWLNHGCPFVKKHYESGNMQKLQKEMVKKGVVWLSVISSAEGKQGFYKPEELASMNKEKKGEATAILVDAEGTVGNKFGAKTTPHMFLIDPKGVVVYQGAIDDTPSTDVDDVPKSKNYVRTAVEEAMAKKTIKLASSKAYGCSIKYK